MAQDFAKLRASDRFGGHRRGRGAAPRSGESSGSHWSWFFTGLFSGLFAAFVAYLAVLKPTAAEVSNAAENSELAGVSAVEEPRPRFDFYDYLPAAEVAVNVEPVAAPPGEVAPPAQLPFMPPATAAQPPAVPEAVPGADATPALDTATADVDANARSGPAGELPPAAEDSALAGTTAALPPAPTPARDLSVVVRAPDNDDFQYLLQAGSFQSSADAERHRARIILLNMDARVVPGTVSGQTWYRVQVGPFSGRQSAEAARDVLAASAIESIPLRMK